MEQRIFMDNKIKPTEQALQEALGNVYDQYVKLMEVTYTYKKEWTFTKTSGWMLKVFDAKKALFYMIPFKHEFKISMAIRENERDLLLQQESLRIFYETLQSAKKYTEGYALQFMITYEKDYINVETLINIIMHMRT